jgi:hypothetical protein
VALVRLERRRWCSWEREKWGERGIGEGGRGVAAGESPVRLGDRGNKWA